MRIGIALLALALATTGCKKKENKPADMAGSGSAMAGSGSAMAGSGSDMGSGSAMAGSGSDMGSGSAAMAGSGSATGSAAGSAADTSMSHHAGNCPSTVFGSTTKAELKGKDVVVTITATDKDAIKSIQTRTDELIKERMNKGKKAGGGSADMGTHDQRGTHGGSIGICPIHIPEGATAKAKHDKGGVTVTITPKDKPDDLKKEIDARIPKAEQWVKDNIKPGDKGTQGAVGGGKGEHGANHSGEGDSKGQERKKEGKDGSGGGKGTGGGGGKGTGGGTGSGSGSAKK